MSQNNDILVILLKRLPYGLNYPMKFDITVFNFFLEIVVFNFFQMDVLVVAKFRLGTYFYFNFEL